MSADRALVLATLPSLDPPHFLAPIITTAATATSRHLTIVLFSRRFNHPNHPSATGVSRLETWNHVLRLLTYVYVQATSVAQSLDKVLMRVDVILHGNDDDFPPSLVHGVGVVYRVAGDSIAVPLPLSISSVRQCFLPPADLDSNEHPQAASLSPTHSFSATDAAPFLPVVALGGTFDHLHAGHKILLSMAAWITSRKLIIGLTDDTLLRNKKYPNLVESFADRASAVRDFLSLFRPGIICDIAPLHDVCGPTGWDPDIQGLVVSHETLSGADTIAAHRASHRLPPLQTHIIDVISPSDVRLDPADFDLMRKTKMSSTFIREWIFESNRKNGEGQQ